MTMLSRCVDAVTYRRTFFDDPAMARKGSMVRLCAYVCCLTACFCAIGTVIFALLNPRETATVAAMIGIITALIAGGCVALLTRTKAGGDIEPPAAGSGGAQ